MDEDLTDRIDYPKEFLRKLRLELVTIERELGEIDERLPWYAPAERRAACYRLTTLLDALAGSAYDASGVIGDHVAALTLYLSRRVP